MKKVMAMLISLAMLFGLTVTANAADTFDLTGSTDIVLNGSFAVATDGTPDNWTMSALGLEEVVAKEVADGEAADNYLFFETGESGKRGSAEQVVETAINVGDTYLLEITYKSPAAANTRVQITNAPYWAPYLDTKLPVTGTDMATSDWGVYRQIIHIPEAISDGTNTYSGENKSIRFTIGAHPWGAAGGCMFDEIKFIKLASETTSWSENGLTGKIVSTNGSFENAINNIPDGSWSIPRGLTFDKSLVTGDSTGAYHGSNYIKFDDSATSDLLFSGTGEPGANYLMQFYYKYYPIEILDENGEGTGTYKTTKANAGVYSEESGNTDKDRSSNYTLPYVETWTPASAMLQLGADRNGSFIFYVRNWAGSDAQGAGICIDNVKIIRLDNSDIRNIVKNGGFELCTSGIGTALYPTYYSGTFGDWYSYSATAYVTDTEKHSGNNSLFINHNSVGSFVWPRYDTAEKTLAYEFSAWVKWSHGTDYGAGTYTTEDAPRISTDTSFSYTFTKEQVNSNDWCYVSTIIPAANMSSSENFRLYLFKAADGIYWDDVCLKPIETCVDIMDASATKILSGLTTAENASYTARAQYTGTEESAQLYIAWYEVTDDIARLKKVNAKTIANDGTAAYCDISGVTTTENTVIRAFLWDGEITPVDSVSIQ